MNFADVVVLMVLGSGEPDSVCGVVRSVDPESGDWTHRIWRRDGLSRRESLDGRVLSVVGPDYSWHRSQGDDGFTRFPRDRHHFASPIGGLSPGGERPSFSRWDGTDFTRPTGPVVAGEFLGRPTWELELAPPSHKPYPVQLSVDAATGLVLRDANRDFGRVVEFVELEIGAELPDELFVWDGPARDADDVRAERDAEHEAELAQRHAWLAGRGLAALPLQFAPELLLHDHSDDSGAFHAAVEFAMHGSLLRRPVSSDPWDEAERERWDHVHRWSDERWDWCFATQTALDDRQLADLKGQLAQSS